MKNILWFFLIFPSIAFSQIKPREKEKAVKITAIRNMSPTGGN